MNRATFQAQRLAHVVPDYRADLSRLRVAIRWLSHKNLPLGVQAQLEQAARLCTEASCLLSEAVVDAVAAAEVRETR